MTRGRVVTRRSSFCGWGRGVDPHGLSVHTDVLNGPMDRLGEMLGASDGAARFVAVLVALWPTLLKGMMRGRLGEVVGVYSRNGLDPARNRR